MNTDMKKKLEEIMGTNSDFVEEIDRMLPCGKPAKADWQDLVNVRDNLAGAVVILEHLIGDECKCSTCPPQGSEEY